MKIDLGRKGGAKKGRREGVKERRRKKGERGRQERRVPHHL